MKLEKSKLPKAISFLVIKLILALASFVAVSNQSRAIAPIFIFFIALDWLDSKAVNSKYYRVYDTIGDRVFVYANFLAFILQIKFIGLATLYIPLLLVRDLVALYAIITKRNFYVQSSRLDVTTILIAAVLFVAEATGALPIESVLSAVVGILLALLIGIQGWDKIRRIRRRIEK